MSVQRAQVLALYRTVLKSHARILPSDMRQLGDSYVREEFRRHKEAKPEFVAAFMSEWSGYLQQLQQGEVGKQLSKEEIAELNDEQQVQLSNLRLETDKQWKDG
jgi:hypothetical protein